MQLTQITERFCWTGMADAGWESSTVKCMQGARNPGLLPAQQDPWWINARFATVISFRCCLDVECSLRTKPDPLSLYPTLHPVLEPRNNAIVSIELAQHTIQILINHRGQFGFWEYSPAGIWWCGNLWHVLAEHDMVACEVWKLSK